MDVSNRQYNELRAKKCPLKKKTSPIGEMNFQQEKRKADEKILADSTPIKVRKVEAVASSPVENNRFNFLQEVKNGTKKLSTNTPSAYKSDRDIVLASVTIDGATLNYADKNFKNDREIVIIAIRSNPLAFKSISDELKADKEIALLAITNRKFEYGFLLSYAASALKKDPEVVLEAIRFDTSNIQFADASVLTDKFFVTQFMSIDGMKLEIVSGFKNDKEVVLAAVKQNGLAIQHANASIKNDIEVAIEAVTQNPEAKQYLSTAVLSQVQAILEERKKQKFILPQQKNQIGEKLSIDESVVDILVKPLEEDKQVIFVGDYGSGKTFAAKTIIQVLTNDDPSTFEIVQFSRTTSYEDFIEGIQPSIASSEDRLQYVMEQGALLRIVTKAKNNPRQAHFLLVDEMNRGDVLSIFGELLYALDRHNPIPVALKHSKKPFILPNNLYIICTMNSVDVSIVKLDNAIYRRFPIIDFNLDINIFELWLKKNYPEDKLDMHHLLKLKKALKDMLQEHHEGIPFSLFMYRNVSGKDVQDKNQNLNEKLEYTWKTKVFPYLRRNWNTSKQSELKHWYSWANALNILKKLK